MKRIFAGLLGCSTPKLAAAHVKSSLRHASHAILILTALSVTAQGHEIRPAIADVTVSANAVSIEMELTLEAFIAGIDLQGLDDTDNAPEAALYDKLRNLDPAALQTELLDIWDARRSTFLLAAGNTALSPELGQISIPEPGNIALPRDSKITLTAPLPDDGSSVTIGWAASNGPLIIRQSGGGDDAYAALLENGEVSAALPRVGYAAEDAMSVFLRFIVQGFEHIIPKGLDHIVFVLGLFFFSLAVRPMLTQVTAFTLAHTFTLALAALGIVQISASIVEPLIAASIVFVAVENIIRPKLGIWRTVVVFGFGLLHGLGFASVLGELGGGQANFVARLIGFNIGVEFGQLAVIAAALLLVGLPFGKQPWYRAAIAIPASLVIAAIGAYWFVERVWL